MRLTDDFATWSRLFPLKASRMALLLGASGLSLLAFNGLAYAQSTVDLDSVVVQGAQPAPSSSAYEPDEEEPD